MFGVFTIVYSAIGILVLAIGSILLFNINSIFGDTLTFEELETTRKLIILMLFNLAVGFPLGIFGSIITAYEKFIFLRVISILRILLNTAVMICLLHYGYKAFAMVILQTCFNLVTLLLNLFYCKYKIKIKVLFRKTNYGFLKEILIYSFWIFLNAIMDRIYWSTGQFVLGATVSSIAVAVFAVAIQLQTIYMSFSTAISSVFLPKITSLISTNCDNKTISELFIKTGRLQYIILIFILSGFIVFGKSFINIWAGEGYSDAYIITLLFFIPLTIPLCQNMGITILQARNQMRFRSLLYIVIAICSLVLQIILAPIYGGIGCAIAIASALTIGQIIIMNIYYHNYQYIDMIKFWKEILKISIVPFIISTVAIIINNHINYSSFTDLILAIISYSFFYLILAWLFSLNKYEKEMFGNIFGKMIKRFA